MGSFSTGRLTLDLRDPGTSAADNSITLNELTVANLTTILDPAVDLGFEIAPMEITATGSLADELGSLLVSLDGDGAGRIQDIAQLPDVLSRLDIVGDVTDFIDFDGMSPEAMLGLLVQLGQWLGAVSGSSVFEQQIPFTDRTVGEVVDLATAYADQVTGLLERLKLDGVGIDSLPADGQLDLDQAINFVVNDGEALALMITQSATADNVSIDDLVTDINESLAGPAGGGGPGRSN